MRLSVAAVLLLALALPHPGCAGESQPVASLAPPGLAADAFPKPDRPVAEIVSPIWATEKQRDAVDEVGQVVRAMAIRPGMTVADLGAGSGYYTVRLARLLGPEGRVLAEDVVPRYLSDLRRRVRRLGLKNVVLGLGEPHDPRLPPGSVDVALLVHMYHEIAQPFAFLANLAPAMRPGGRVGIVDLDRVTWEHGTPPDLLRCELAAVGYREAGFRTLKGGVGYLAIFEAPASPKGPETVVPCRMQRPPA